MTTRRKLASLALLVLLCSCSALAAPPVDYYVSLAHARTHVVHVRIHLAGTSADRDVQLPVWNALYQVRDFAQNVRVVRAHNDAGLPLPVHKLDKTTWRISGAESGAEVEYDLFADSPGTWGAQLNLDHAFFNLAELLMYPTDARDSLMTVTFSDLPPRWRIATMLPLLRAGGTQFTARNYDRLVDSPVEIGEFKEAVFEEGGGTFHVVVDADPGDYEMNAVVQTVHKLVTAEMSWMNDRPFNDYMFIYHFPKNGGSGGGMEHAFSTAIDVSAERLQDDPLSLPSVTAHEFFHLWNVKRIRSQALEPPDYTKENYTDTLWFAEGVTDAVQEYMLLRAGFLDPQRFLQRLSREIRNLQLRPARLTQSAEESSLECWFEKYPQYRMGDRSISYYNKGEILGVLLDLAVREVTHGRKSLRDVFLWMNQNYAKQDLYYPETKGIRAAVEKVTGADFAWFFDPYVAGTEELPYDDLLRTAGLSLQRKQITTVNAGFTSIKNFDANPVVVVVDQDSEAEHAGLTAGDTIVLINGKVPTSDVEDYLGGMKVGDLLHLRVAGRRGTRDLKFKIGGTTREDYQIVESDKVTQQQRERRAAWLAGEDQPLARPAAGAGAPR